MDLDYEMGRGHKELAAVLKEKGLIEEARKLLVQLGAISEPSRSQIGTRYTCFYRAVDLH